MQIFERFVIVDVKGVIFLIPPTTDDLLKPTFDFFNALKFIAQLMKIFDLTFVKVICLEVLIPYLKFLIALVNIHFCYGNKIEIVEKNLHRLRIHYN